jgi:hypothetical protein
LQNFSPRATWNCISNIKFFDQPEDALATQPNSCSHCPDCNSRNSRVSEFASETLAHSVHAGRCPRAVGLSARRQPLALSAFALTLIESRCE